MTVSLLLASAALTMLVILAVRAAAISHAERRRLRRRLAAALIALDHIEIAADRWKDIDSVLATDVRSILRAYRNDAILIPPPPPPPPGRDHAP